VYIGDFPEDYATLNYKFTTRTTAGVPATLGGTPVISVYESNSVTQITAGITLTADFDSVTGLNNVLIDLSASALYTVDTDFQIVITTGTVNSVSVVGEVVGSFSIERSGGVLALIKAGNISANVTQISGDSTAADNLELQYDTTGLAGDNFPATQLQIGQLSVGSAAISTVAESYTLTTGTQSSGTYTDTETANDVAHQHTDTAGAMELYYQFDVGGSGVASEVSLRHYLTSSNDTVGIYAYNWGGASWDKLGDRGGSSATYQIDNWSLLTRNTGTGANLGKVRIRYYEAAGMTSATLAVDKIDVSYAVVSQSVGYDGGQVWIDTVNGTSGVESYVNGVADNPVDTLASATTIAGNVGLNQYYASNDSTITFASSRANEVWKGYGWACVLGGQEVGGTHIFHGNDVSGTGICSAECHIVDSHVGVITLGQSHFSRCGFKSSFTANAAAEFFVETCYSEVAGASNPTFDFSGNGASSTISVREWYGGGTWTFDADCTASIEVPVGGSHTITTGGGDIEFRGAPKNITVTTSGTGTTNIVVWSGCPIVVNGAAGTVNVYGLHNGITGTYAGSVTDLGADITDIPSILLDTDAIKALLDDPRGEPGQGALPVNPDIVTKIDYLYKLLRNKKDNDGTTTKFYADDGTTVDQKQTTSESGGTVTKGEIESGP